MQNAVMRSYKSLLEKIDIPFLLFLITISSNKIYLKAVALVLIFALRPKFNFFFNKRLSLFYPIIAIYSVLHFLLFDRNFELNYLLLFTVGIVYWITCYAYMFQTYLFVQDNNLPKVNRTLSVYMLINFSIILYNYMSVCVSAHSLTPFAQEDGSFGTSAGDYIWGLFGAPSYINSMASSLLALYFLNIKHYRMFLISCFVVFLPFANVITMVFLAVLFLFIFLRGEAMRRIMIAGAFVMCFLLYYFVSPNNFSYMQKTVKLSLSKNEEIMPKVELVETKDTTKLKPEPEKVKYVNDSSAAKQKVVVDNRNALFNKDYSAFKKFYPINLKTMGGKKIAVMQTLNFLKENPKALIFGAGMGNFSSRLAFQFSGRDSSRIFKRVPKYASGYYYKNHLLVFDAMSGLPPEYHSIKHFPNNFFSQLVGEYGLIGMGLFLVLYLWFFYKRFKNKYFFVVLLICISSFLMLDYLFEFFNVMVIFEIVMYCEIKRQEESNPA